MYFRSMTLLFLFHAYDFFKTWNYTVQYVADSNSRMPVYSRNFYRFH